MPVTQQGFWREKLESNKDRDRRNRRRLRGLGWSALVVWECEIEEEPDKVIKRIERFLEAE